MSEAPATTIASDMIMATVSLLAITLVVLMPTWSRFQKCMSQTKTETKPGGILVFGPIQIAIPLALIVFELMSVSVDPITWYWEMSYSFLVIVFPLMIPTLMLGISKCGRLVQVNHKRNDRGSETSSPGMLSKGLGATIALLCFVIAVVISMMIVMLAIQPAIGVQLEETTRQENFEIARALISVLPFTLAFGLGWLGLSYLVEFLESMRNSKNR